MKLLKIFSISSFVFFSLILATPVSAVATLPATPSTQNTIDVADVNFYQAKVVSQNGNVFNLSFNIAGNEGAQAGLKYNVKLIKETTKGQFLADEYTYPEILSLSSNTTLSKNIVYTAPPNLTGDYTILITLENGRGLPVGLGIAGKVKLVSTANTVEILPETCFLSVVGEKDSPKYNLTQGVDIASTETISLNCTAVNSLKTNISAVPSYATHYRTASGDIVSQQGGDVSPISFNAGETKSISLLLPKALKPQAYDVKATLSSGGVSSNSIFVHYVLHGVSATIQNFSLDKDYYIKDETAKISFLWSPSADSFPGSRLGASSLSDITLIAQITNNNQKECIAPINQVLTETGSVELSAPVIENCKNPQVSIALKDANGNTLDQKILSFQSKTEPINSGTKTIIIIFGILVVLGIALYFINLKKKENAIIINQ